MKTTAEKIRYYRELNKMSQESLASLSNISASAIRKYESGVLVPGEDHLAKIASSLHISPAALKDSQLTSKTDLYPLFFSLSQELGIEFVKSESSLYYRFTDSDLDDFFGQMQEEYVEIENASKLISEQNSDEIRTALVAAKQRLEEQLEKKLVLDRIQKELYTDIDLEKEFPIKIIQKKYNLKPLKTYSPFFDCILSLTRTNIDFNCIGIYGRLWIPKLILTFPQTSIDTHNMSALGEEVFSSFIYYLYNFRKSGSSVDAYTFIQEDIVYYRFILVDKILAPHANDIMDLYNAMRTKDFPYDKRIEIENRLKQISTELETPITISNG